MYFWGVLIRRKNTVGQTFPNHCRSPGAHGLTRMRRQHRTLGLDVGHVKRISLLAQHTHHVALSHTQPGGAPTHCTSAGETSTRTQQAPGNNFHLQVNLVDEDDQIPDPTPDEVGESEVMHIHDLVDESYFDSEDELMEAEQGFDPIPSSTQVTRFVSVASPCFSMQNNLITQPMTVRRHGSILSSNAWHRSCPHCQDAN
ncbi:hypothetical protein SARC_00887 [Sphaeroforma arctica JP610]|uniref:Uncharacterized protein n=1 Tax=Sphaeroforma arctica JP610 TaxID=667725 RepID=A0A0L0GDK0_9EUKA|nr:hypothetical protein SARC_00887 [Sphaeroforma arctica JP610]KNC86994.1 hypothetical protein SARC_00887 [Sphaeroforma arctica JP610]|eukprot:XP_014160896.1 hypothetical protein SARC_00887 [Sphaeroforma arctica JP610]